MKRSRSVKLLTMTSMSLAVAACGDVIDTEGQVYRTVADCRADNFVPDADCAPLIAEGTRMHLENATRYESHALCEAEEGQGQCFASADKGQNFFSTAPAGYIVTGALAGAAVSNLVRPVYNDRYSRNLYIMGGGPVYYLDNGRYGAYGRDIRRYDPTVRRAPPRVQKRTSVASRMGFGSRTRRFGG